MLNRLGLWLSELRNTNHARDMEDPEMRIVVGLGNPGRKYNRTRHNIGFDVLAELARRHATGRPRLKFEADIVEVRIHNSKTLLVAPQTFMNASGRSVQRVVEFFKTSLKHLCVISDDMNLETGRLRWRPSGSAGGQKGLNDIINRIGSKEFARLRIGIGRPPAQMDAAAWVLAKFRAEETDTIQNAVTTAADSVELWIYDGVEAAMNTFNAVN